MMYFQVDKSKLPIAKREELKRKEDEKLAKEVYAEFVATFDESPSSKISKTFVRGEVVNADTTTGGHHSRPRLYKPNPTLFKPTESPVNAARRQAEEKARKIMDEAMRNRPQKPGTKMKETNKRTSNLEAFKEELRKAQEERANRRKLRQQLQDQLGMDKEPLDRIAPSLDNPYLGTYDTDPNTTNLFLSNINPKLSEEELCQIFGHFGPLASVKIMWPRSDDERVRGYHTGFIAFMTRKDAERSVTGLKGKSFSGFEMKLSWGKGVPIPAHPIYIPPKMLEMALPPLPSGLPFNAQYNKEDRDAYRLSSFPPPGALPPQEPEHREPWDKMIRNAVVKVVIPTERPLLCAIHRMVEFVVREGPMFEAMIMNREMNNPLYRFLFDNQSPAHGYYRWKLFSILQGDSPSKWSTKEFRLFENGSLWRPPVMNFYHQGLPRELYDESELMEDDEEPYQLLPSDKLAARNVSNSPPSGEEENARPLMPPPSHVPFPTAGGQTGKRGQLTEKQRRKVEEMLKNLTPEREKICDAMIYCVEHGEAAEEIVDLVCESICTHDSSIPRKIAKLFLLSDILANCTAKVLNVSYFRKHIGIRLEEIFSHIHNVYEKIDARLKAEQFKQRILACFRSWEETAVYPTDFLIRLQNVFLGLIGEPEKPVKNESEFSAPQPPSKKSKWDSDSDAEFETLPLKVEQKEPVVQNVPKRLVDYDLDGVPLEDDDETDSVSSNKTNKSRSLEEKSTEKSMFVKSKWEEVDPDSSDQQQGVSSTSKWDKNEAAKTEDIFFDDDIDGVPMDDSANTPADATPSVSRVSHVALSVDDMSEDERKQLREIELKVMKFQDELESGAKKRSSGLSIQEEVSQYREKLLQKIQDKQSSSVSTSSGKRHRSSSITNTSKKEEKKSDKSRDKEKSHKSSASRHESDSGKKSKHHHSSSSSTGGGTKSKTSVTSSTSNEPTGGKKSSSDVSVEKSSKSKKRSRSPSTKKSKRNKKSSPSRSSSPHSSSSSKHKKKKH